MARSITPTGYGRLLSGLTHLSATIVAISLKEESSWLCLSLSETCNSPLARIYTTAFLTTLLVSYKLAHLYANVSLVVGPKSSNKVFLLCNRTFGYIGKHCVCLQYFVNVFLPAEREAAWMSLVCSLLMVLRFVSP